MRNFRILIVSMIGLMLTLDSIGQSMPMYSQYMYNMVNINPAYAGSRGVPSLSALWREQWAGLPGSPTTKSFSYDLPTNDKKMGLGVQLFDDKYVNYIKRTGLNLYYNIKIPVSNNGVLSMGLKGGLYNDTKNIVDAYRGASSNIASDIALLNNFNRIIPLAGAGIYYNDDKFYAGFSAPDVLVFSKVQSYSSDKSLYQVNEVHYFLTSGYSFDVNDEVQFKPSFLLKATSGAPIEIDLNTNIWLRNIIGGGVSYRTNESVLAMLETQATPQLRFGYAYDMPFKRPNSHELFLRYELGRLFPKSKSYKTN
jgi:type IX secretion system PorP/SprF family membrane protein